MLWKRFHDNPLKNNLNLQKKTYFNYSNKPATIRCSIFMCQKNQPTQLCQNAFIGRIFISYLQKMLFQIYLDKELCMSFYKLQNSYSIYPTSKRKTFMSFILYDPRSNQRLFTPVTVMSSFLKSRTVPPTLTFFLSKHRHYFKNPGQFFYRKVLQSGFVYFFMIRFGLNIVARIPYR